MPYKDPEKQKAAQRKHYLDNVDKYKLRNKTYRESLRSLVRNIKESEPCKDCGVTYPYYVMEFDHTEDNKIARVSYLMNNGSEKETLEEIAKCDLICSNCHKVRTWQRMQ